jgi:hypothetical protein
MPLLLWLIATFGRSGELRVRLLLALLSAVAVLLNVGAGWYVGGTTVALLAGGLLLLHPERLLLSCHIWPDGLVALAIAAATLLLVLPTPVTAPLLLTLGLTCAVGSLARIDFLIVAPTVCLSLFASGRIASAATTILVVAPSLLVAGLWTARNFRRYGIALPDNTWTLNLMVTHSEIERRTGGDFALEPILSEAWLEWRDLPSAERGSRALRSLRGALARPRRFLRGVVRRFLALCGPDTFLRQRLLPPHCAYPDLGFGWRRRFDSMLQLGFPLLVSLTVLGCALNRQLPPPYTWPAFSLLTGAVLFFARTRFRGAQLPILSLLAADGLVRLPRCCLGHHAAQIVVVLGFALLLGVLLHIRCAREMPS